MTVKEANVLNWWFAQLCALVEKEGHEVTAGELAGYMGQSRATAHKHLSRMKKEGVVESRKVPHWNGAKKTVYFPAERD